MTQESLSMDLPTGKREKKKKEKDPCFQTPSLMELTRLNNAVEEGKQALHTTRIDNISLRDTQTKLLSKIKLLEKKNAELTAQVDGLSKNQEKDNEQMMAQAHEVEKLQTTNKQLKSQLKTTQKSLNQQIKTCETMHIAKQLQYETVI